MNRKETRELYARFDASETMKGFFTSVKGLRPKNNGGTSLETYRGRIYQFFKNQNTDPDRWMAGVRAGKIDPKAVFNRYLQQMSNKPDIGDKTILASRDALLKFSKEMELGDLDLTTIKQPSLKRVVTAFDKPEIQKILNLAGSRDRAVILLAATCGARVGEIAQLTVNDLAEIFNRTEEPYAIPIGKTMAKAGNAYVVFTTEETAKVLRDFITAHGLKGEDVVFYGKRTIERAFQRLVKQAGLPGTRAFHSLRKFVRTTLEGTVKNTLWAEALIGHNMGSLQKIYGAALPLDEFRKQYTKALPELTFFGTPMNGRIVELQEEVRRLNERLQLSSDPKNQPLKVAIEEYIKQNPMGLIHGFDNGDALGFIRSMMNDVAKDMPKPQPEPEVKTDQASVAKAAKEIQESVKP